MDSDLRLIFAIKFILCVVGPALLALHPVMGVAMLELLNSELQIMLIWIFVHFFLLLNDERPV